MADFKMASSRVGADGAIALAKGLSAGAKALLKAAWPNRIVLPSTAGAGSEHPGARRDAPWSFV